MIPLSSPLLSSLHTQHRDREWKSDSSRGCARSLNSQQSLLQYPSYPSDFFSVGKQIEIFLTAPYASSSSSPAMPSPLQSPRFSVATDRTLSSGCLLEHPLLSNDLCRPILVLNISEAHDQDSANGKELQRSSQVSYSWSCEYSVTCCEICVLAILSSKK
jgi:hypothetical protein